MISIETKKMVSFLKAVYYMYEYDFVDYKYETLKRRMQAHCLKLNIKSFEQYSHHILSHKKHFEEMFRYFSINVTEFFREENSLKALKEEVLPYLNSFFHIKIWIPGCSSGETAYSLAIVLEEMGLLHKSQIYATDFNKAILKKAKEGRYSIDNLDSCEKNYNRFGGEKSFKEYIEIDKESFRIKPSIKEKVLFFNHNLVCDSVMNEFQLVICQNVFIYFNDNLKQKVTQLLSDSLCVNGFFLVGKNDYIEKSSLTQFKEYSNNKKVYQKCK